MHRFKLSRSPIGFSGSGIWLISRPGFGILKEKGDQIRDCNYDRDTKLGDFNRRESGNVTLKKPRFGKYMQRKSSWHLTREKCDQASQSPLNAPGNNGETKPMKQMRKTAYWSTIQAVAEIWLTNHFLLITTRPTMMLVEFRRWIARQLFCLERFHVSEELFASIAELYFNCSELLKKLLDGSNH